MPDHLYELYNDMGMEYHIFMVKVAVDQLTK